MQDIQAFEPPVLTVNPGARAICSENGSSNSQTKLESFRHPCHPAVVVSLAQNASDYGTYECVTAVLLQVAKRLAESFILEMA
jgi:hypothetical protein